MRRRIFSARGSVPWAPEYGTDPAVSTMAARFSRGRTLGKLNQQVYRGYGLRNGLSIRHRSQSSVSEIDGSLRVRSQRRGGVMTLEYLESQPPLYEVMGYRSYQQILDSMVATVQEQAPDWTGAGDDFDIAYQTLRAAACRGEDHTDDGARHFVRARPESRAGHLLGVPRRQARHKAARRRDV